MNGGYIMASSRFVEVMTEEDTYTENGAVTNSTSHDSCLDLFFLAGACRNETEQNIINKLVCAYEQDRVKCLKIIFWAGDIRQGAGERRFFKFALNWLNNNHREDLEKYLSYVPEFSRWNVLFDLANENETILNYICENIKTNGLLCKWLPRKIKVTDKHKKVNDNKTTITKKTRILYNGLAKKIQKKLGISAKEYRKLLVANTKVVEQQMCKKRWNEIKYENVPSVAMNKYNKAWYRNDEERFKAYIESVNKGEKKINASAIFPHDIIKNAFSIQWGGNLNNAQITQWENLPNYLENSESNSIIPVCDVSGSMHGLPICISVALGLYISERNEGIFKNAFITFSEHPQMQVLKGNINERIKQLINQNWDMNTNFAKVFELILNKAIINKLSQDEIPRTILAISDMEFDEATDDTDTNYKYIKKLYEQNGYKLPQIVFWNVNGRVGNVPVTMRDENVALISGASPSIIKSVLTNNISPIKIMNNTVESERYSFIS
jgi:hypothetical protein